MFFNNPRAFAWAFWLSCGSPRSASSLIDSRVLGSTRAVPFFSKTTPFLRCTLCVCLLCGCGRRMSRHRKGGSSGWWCCKASPWFCFGALWAWGLALVDSELLLLITGSDWSATCAFRRHGIQEIGLPPARLGASPTCRWPHTSATPKAEYTKGVEALGPKHQTCPDRNSNPRHLCVLRPCRVQGLSGK